MAEESRENLTVGSERKIAGTIRPNARARRFYADQYAQYRRLYPALKPEFARIAELGGA